MLNKPLKNAFIAQYKLPQALNHTEALQPKIFNRLFDEITIIDIASHALDC